jgi:hypothetical protein
MVIRDDYAAAPKVFILLIIRKFFGHSCAVWRA